MMNESPRLECRPAPAGEAAIPPDLVLTPVSRRPTTLASETVATVMGFPARAASLDASAGGQVPAASIVVVTIDNLLFLKLCLTSVLASLPRDGELIVIDNASRDGTAEYLRELQEAHRDHLRVISNSRNRGFGPATNQGLAAAAGEMLVLLNDDTVVHPGWLAPLARMLRDPLVGLVGPVTNRTGNEAQIQVPYRTYGELVDFAAGRASTAADDRFDIPVATMFCVAMRREVFARIGDLDERFEVGLFEDDDYSRRARAAGYRVVCAEGAFVHHFGETSFGKLVPTGERSALFEANRRRFEEKWQIDWEPHRRRPSDEYEHVAEEVRRLVCGALPRDGAVVVITKGDDRLIDLEGRTAWHFPQRSDGAYAGHHPADSADALAQLEALRAQGARFLVVPITAFWYFDHYRDFAAYLHAHARVIVDEAACRVFALERAGPTAPRCSVVIPVYDKPALTRQCLDSLIGAPSDCSLEIVVADDASGHTTERLLASYNERIHVVRHEVNAGFARACNDGAAAARGEYLVFLNNDTLPEPGWLDALVAYADRHERAAVVGSKLLYPDGTVQHAGIVFDKDRYPRHLYVGFPGDHPAVNISRRFQAVTGACMLVRRGAFERVGGFDLGYRNGLEDVDLCLRLGALGYEVHYCHTSVVQHLESVTHGGFRDRANNRLYSSRWCERVRPDDVAYYAQDGLLQIAYRGACPAALSVSPLLASIDESARGVERERLLQIRSRQVAELLRDTVRLTVKLAERSFEGNQDTGAAADAAPTSVQDVSVALDSERAAAAHNRLVDCERQLEAALLEFQRTFSLDMPSLEHRDMVRRIRRIADLALPPGSRVVVISRGDDELVSFSRVTANHFPQSPDGSYSGHHPADSDEAIAHLEDLRRRGADFLLIPETSTWWMAHYGGFADHVRRLPVIADQPGTCLIFALSSL